MSVPVTITLVDEAGERRRSDRRAQDRRTPKRTLNTLFAATLVNQITPQDATLNQRYPRASGPRAGIAFNLSA